MADGTTDLPWRTSANADTPFPGELAARIMDAAGEYAVEGTRFSRGNLGRAMRRAVAAGLRREQVIALSVLPREEAELLMSGPCA